MADERWFTVAEIAALLKTQEKTVRQWLRDGKLKGRAFSGRMGWRVRESDLNAFLNDDEGNAVA